MDSNNISFTNTAIDSENIDVDILSTGINDVSFSFDLFCLCFSKEIKNAFSGG